MPVRLKSFLIALLVAFAAGCANTSLVSKADLAPDATLPSKPPASSRAESNGNGPISLRDKNAARPPAKAEVEAGSGKFINEEVAKQPLQEPAADGQITFNFDNQPIQAVVQAILGELLKENYTIAPGVAGNVTFSTSKPIRPDQALSVLEMLLSWTRNALVYKEGRYLITTVAEAIPGNLTPRIAPPKLAKGYEVRVFPLHFISPTEMAKLLKPYVRAEAVVSVDTARSMLIMAGNAAELENYQRTIDIFDVDWLKGMSVGVFTLEHVEVETIMPDLEKIFGATGESPMAGMFRFIPMTRMNSIAVITPNREYLDQAEKWLHRLDMGDSEHGTQLYVYDVKNVKAADLSDKLNEIFTGARAAPKRSGGNVAPGLAPVEIRGINDPSKRAQTQRAVPTQPAAPVPPKANATGSDNTDIRITSIEENNQILVLSTASEWDTILSAIKRLDTAPLQVQIETKILEVSLTGGLSLGVQWYLAGLIDTSAGSAPVGSPWRREHDRHRAAVGQGSVAPPSGSSPPALFYSYLNKDYEVAINALEKNGNTKVLSAPSLVVLNNKEAKISVGDQIPVVQNYISGISPLTTTTGSGSSTSSGLNTSATVSGSVQFRDTGVLLTVTPRVNPGGLVYLDVNQEVSAPKDKDATGNATIAKRSLETSIAVQSGETVMLGGLIADNEQENKAGVPGLSRIPILGHLFGNTTRDRQRTELIVLITPTVINNSQDAREVTEEYQRRFQSLKPLRQKSQSLPAQATAASAPETSATQPPAPTPPPTQVVPATPPVSEPKSNQ